MKKYLALLMLLVVACASQPSTPTQPNEPAQPSEPSQPAEPVATAGVTREIPDTVAAGAEATIKLDVELEDGQTYYLFEEKVPMEFEVLDGEPDSNNVLKHIVIQDADSEVIEYRVKAPAEPGTYTWSGEYAVDGMKDPAAIMGDTTITVQ